MRDFRHFVSSFILAGGVCTLIAANGQEVLAPPPLDFSQPAPSLRRLGTNQLEAPELIVTPAQPLQWGPVEFHPHPLYRFIYGDGIPTSPGHQATTAINEISPGVLFGFGSHWTLDYTPSLRFYSSKEFRDTVDHYVALNGGTHYEDWVLGVSQRVSLTSTPLIETASQTDQQNYNTLFSAVRSLGSQMSLELSFSQDLRFLDENDSSQGLSDSRQWSTMDWLNYQFWPNFGAALGAGFGYVDVSVGSDTIYEQLQGRINWRVVDKLNFLLSGGFDDRQFLNSSLRSLVTPIMSASIQYKIFEETFISLDANHSINPSYFADQLTESTHLGGALRQRLLGKLYLDVSGGYQTSTYHANSAGVNINRKDDYTYVNIRLSAPFLKRGSVSVFYQASDNTSNETDFQSTSNQVGFELGFRY